MPLQKTMAERVRCGAEIFQALGVRLRKQGYSALKGDEGGYAPKLKGIYSKEFEREQGEVAKELMREQTLKTLKQQFAKASEKDVQIVEEYLMAYELDKQEQGS